MERFFTQHNVMKDRDLDELCGRVRSDSEARHSTDQCLHLAVTFARFVINSDDEVEVSEQVHSVHDPTGPWRQTPVSGDSAWGQPGKRAGGGKQRDFRSQFTGPKGVLNDYKAHKRGVRDERARKEQERRDVLSRIATGVTAINISSKTKSYSNNQIPGDCCSDGSDCECYDNDDDDADLVNDAFLQQYQQQRLQEMQDAIKRRKQYGELEVISPEQFVQLTDAAEPQCVLFVHLFHPENYACGLLNAHLAHIAAEIPHVKFTAMVAKDADESIAIHDLPVLLIYRGKQLDDTVVGVTKELDGEFTLERVRKFIDERVSRF